jgi:hypothetical protein
MKRRWWVLDQDGGRVWDCYTQRGARNLARLLNRYKSDGPFYVRKL